MKEGSLGKKGVVQVGEKKYREQEGESDKDAYIPCGIYI